MRSRMLIAACTRATPRDDGTTCSVRRYLIPMFNAFFCFLITENLVVAGIPMSGQKLAIFLGASIGTLVCLLMLVSGVIYLKYRRNKTLTDKARRSPTLGHLTGTHRSQGK